MRNKYYIFNPDTRTYDRVYPNFAQKFLTNLRRVLLFTIFGGLAFLAFNILIDKPSVEKLESKNSQILAQYEILSRRIDEAMLVLQDMQQRDDNLYRVMLDAEPLSPATRHAGYGGTNRYDELLKMDNSELLVQTTQKIDLLEKQIYLQTKSFDEIVELDKDTKSRLRHTPAIQPISPAAAACSSPLRILLPTPPGRHSSWLPSDTNIPPISSGLKTVPPARRCSPASRVMQKRHWTPL